MPVELNKNKVLLLKNRLVECLSWRERHVGEGELHNTDLKAFLWLTRKKSLFLIVLKWSAFWFPAYGWWTMLLTYFSKKHKYLYLSETWLLLYMETGYMVSVHAWTNVRLNIVTWTSRSKTGSSSAFATKNPILTSFQGPSPSFQLVIWFPNSLALLLIKSKQ